MSDPWRTSLLEALALAACLAGLYAAVVMIAALMDVL